MGVLGVAAVVCVSVGSALVASSYANEQSHNTGTRSSSGGKSYSTAGSTDGLPAPPSTVLPPAFDAYADFGDPFEPDEPGTMQDTTVFLHVPRSGGMTMMEIMGRCAELVLASDVGVRDGHDADETLEVIETSSGSYVNCDTTTPQGISRCADMGLVPSGLVDIISTSLPYDAANLFQTSSSHRARMFLLLRPVLDRAVSYYHWIQQASWDSNYDPQIALMSLKQYANIPYDRAEFNFLTKTLSNNPGPTTALLTNADLDVAKEVLRRKAVVGLLTEKGDSLLRFEKYFGWEFGTGESRTCEEELLHWEWMNQGAGAGNMGDIDPTGEGRAMLERRNWFDIQLYEYAEALFVDQRKFFLNLAAQQQEEARVAALEAAGEGGLP